MAHDLQSCKSDCQPEDVPGDNCSILVEPTVTDVQDLVTAAEQLARQGNHREAASLLQQCLRMEPTHPDRRKWVIARARALYDSSQPARAMALLRRSCRLHPGRTDFPAQLALMYQRAGAPDRAAPLWRDLLDRFPDSPDRRWWLPSAAFALMDLGQFDVAEQFCQEATATTPDASDAHNAMSALWERRGDFPRALDAIERGLSVGSADKRVSFVLSRVRVLAEVGAIAECEVALEEELIRAPASIRLLAASAALAGAQGPTEKALQRWERCIDVRPDAPDGYRGMAAMLRSTGDAFGARSLLEDACRRFAMDPSLWQALAEACAQCRDMESAHRAWRQAERLAPFSIYRLWAQCAFLGACGARAEAEALLARRRAAGRVLWRGRYEYAKAARELGEALACLDEIQGCSDPDAWLAHAEAEIRSWRQDVGDLERAADVLRRRVTSSPEAVRTRSLLARVLVMLGDPARARAHIEAISPAEQRKDVAEARLWMEVEGGDWTVVRSRWEALEGRFFLPALHLPAAGLSLLGERFTPPAKGGILAVSVVRNELPRLAGFLDHHRKLGVDGFVIVDNASQDGTVEFLAAQPDVRLYSTSESFSQSSFGVRWLNQVIDMHACGWVLYADADEKLVFPGSEQRPLADLTGYLTARGEQVVPAVMLDMFPARLAADGNEARDWFDPPRLRPGMNCPFVEAAGGARRRLFGTTVTLTKAPLIHATAGVRYLGSHHTTPAPVSGVTAAFLHDHLGYLFDPGNMRRMADEAARAEHSDHAVDRRRMLRTLAELAGSDLRGPDSIRYADSGQLVELGLIHTTPAFESFAGS